MRSEVMWFANRMEKKLNQRMAHKTGWYNTDYKVLLKRLMIADKAHRTLG